MRYTLLASLVLFFFSVSCNIANKSEKKALEEVLTDTNTEINIWDKIDIQDVPFTLSSVNFDYIRRKIYSLDAFYKFLNVDYLQTHELNTVFNGFTEIRHRPWNDFFEKPSGEQGHFFQRLPNVKNNKLVLFAVLDKNLEDFAYGDKYVWLELQTFNEENKFVDKMIVFMCTGGECSFDRNFIYDKNNTIRIKDRVICRDTDEDATILSDETTNYVYKIRDDGKIVEVK